jgi:uncharacterized membrane protein
VDEHQTRLLPPRATPNSGNRKNFPLGEIPANSGNFFACDQTSRKLGGFLSAAELPPRERPARPLGESLVTVPSDMSTVHAQIEIDAPIERVWDIVMDPQRLADWVTIHRSVQDVSEQPLRRGSTMDQVLHIRSVSFHVHWTLTDVSSPHRAEWEGQGPAHSVARIRYELSGDAEGPVRFAYTNEFIPPGGRLGSMASRFIVGATSQREANNSLARLKALVERG